jgi:hypothetical protein
MPRCRPPTPNLGEFKVPQIGGFGGRPLGKLASCKAVQNTGQFIDYPDRELQKPIG